MDYQQLNALKPSVLSTILEWPLAAEDIEYWQGHWRFDVKRQGQLFVPMVPAQSTPLNESQTLSWQLLLNAYEQLLQPLVRDKNHDAS